MSEDKSIGGVELKHVITFQTQILMGAQFGRIKNAVDCKDIMVACMRMGWNDAFRHTSKNTKYDDGKSVLDIRSAEWNKEHKEDYDDYICNILGQENVIKAFCDYAKSKTAKDKVNAVIGQFEELKEIFKEVKEIEGERQLCFGHFQKMFNIAIKLYLCLYMCRRFLNIADNLFCEEIIENLQNADCPVDSIILDCLRKETANSKYSDYKWSKFGTDKHLVDEYIDVQEEISELECVIGKSNLYYDFIAWEK